jgi:indolepyruvate ferredoxin oxidoreductase
VARYLFKLMAYKDEYEVARLYSDEAFLRQVRETFDGDLRLHVHLSPPILSPTDKAGQPRAAPEGGRVVSSAGRVDVSTAALFTIGKRLERRSENIGTVTFLVGKIPAHAFFRSRAYSGTLAQTEFQKN